MRAVVITKHGGPEALQVQERPDPQLNSGEVRIEVAACGINFADLMARLGFYPDAPKPPCVVGYEVAGTVAALGSGVDGGVQVGQRVFAPVRFNGYAERAAARVDGVIALPDELSFEQGAAIPINYCTAWEALIRQGNLQPGQRGPIHSARGAGRKAPRPAAPSYPAPRRGPSPRRSRASASTTGSTTQPAAGGDRCRRSISSWM